MTAQSRTIRTSNAGNNGAHQQIAILKYAIPNGTTAANVAGASLTIRNFHNTTPPINLYTFSSASSTVVGGDYAAYVATRTLVTTAVFTNGNPATISGHGPRERNPGRRRQWR